MLLENPYVPILFMIAVAMVFSGVFLGLSWILGPKKPTESKLSVYECGLNPIGNARERFSVKFYLVAMLFIIFDLEVVFLYPWALNYKDSLANGQGLFMLAVMGIFFVVLTIGLIYEFRKGALDWAPKKKLKRPQA
ncbi:MAG: NADH-quinone oxidoreductase subunit A [Deltaproteobacteria bacterium]|nr:NADH-quinone oxidoreductase subunit A [Deltaproteobacteria bacterium]